MTTGNQPQTQSEAITRDKSLDLSKLLFSPEGRINRAKFWLGELFLFIFIVIGMAIDLSAEAGGAIYILFAIIQFWPALCINIKRCHDRDKSGWFMLVSLIPLLGIWYLVEIGFLQGTSGDNRFGPDPLR